MEFIRQNLYLIIPAVTSGLAFLYFTFNKTGKKNALTTTQSTVLINREEVEIVDLRNANEYEDGHVPGARNLPYSQFGTRVGELERFKDKPLLLVCARGRDAAEASVKLSKAGFTRAHFVDGGLEAWREDGLLLKKGSKR